MTKRTHEQFVSLVQDALFAERSRVFEPTPVDPESLLSGETPAWTSRKPSRISYRRLGLALAACLAMAVGIGVVWQAVQPVSSPSGASGGAAAGLVDNGSADCPASYVLFRRCVTGPFGDEPVGECSCFDLDADGDVDFVDFGKLQRQVSSSRG